MDLAQRIKDKKDKIALVGLGYVGMPIAIEFAKQNIDVIGFDINEEKVEKYKNGIDPTNEVGDDAIKNTKVEFTSDESKLDEAKFFIVAVPTPINEDKTPNLKPVESATETVAKHISKGSVVVFESTVYPGVTEDVCVPIIEKISGLKCGEDFKVGYSPERINPTDKVHTLKNITKIVSGCDEESLECIKDIYDLVVDDTYPVSSIKTAEAIKVVENSQRDINIAFMNELAMVFDKMDINTNEVIDGMNTKWNALGFKPGLVGGHCIGVDPYYFIYEAENLGYHSQIVLSGRKVNDGMGEFIGNTIIEKIKQAGIDVESAKVAVLGLSFKENCPDLRNTKVVDIINVLNENEITPKVVDSYVDKEIVEEKLGLEIESLNNIKDMNCVIFAVAHDEYKDLSTDEIDNMFDDNQKKVLIDVKGIFDQDKMEERGFTYWSL